MQEFSDLLKLMETLRGEKGCPWDKKQTLESFKTFLLEEVYELLEAIDKNDSQALKEELGDLLFHIVFICQICKEEGRFEMKDVVVGTYNKMVKRHPHVFLNEKIKEPIPKRWEEIKKEEKENYSLLRNIPKEMPALLRAYVITKKVSRVGFDWEKVEDVFSKLNEEIEELKEAQRLSDKKKIEEEIGDLLFTAVNLARFLGIEPEDALRKAIDKFIDRFSYIERKIDLNSSTQKTMDELWEERKDMERGR
ncbi:MAG: nucleoside triphosphate pyrophosphohydrolase [Desulfobacterota bacterium]|nr:nucleoside triphosphate pyrophosphohydrolase [Thermodesulfobacteriota bacterium]MDW8002049.1 nucleoside triphosphate pyrophosphohydrolase [Deltaproteobacteria bacterium]